MSDIHKKKIISLLAIVLIYTFAFIVGVFVYTFTTGLNDILRLFISTMVIATLIYIISLIVGTTSLIDPFWSVQTPALMLFLMIVYNAFNLGTILYFLVFSFWALRLTFNFFYQCDGFTYEDYRYKKIREKTGKAYFLVSYLGFYILTTGLVFVASVPMYLYIIEIQDFGTLQLIGLIVMTAGAFLQSEADSEMHHFKKERSKKTQVLSKKLWKYSRHPNYLGEIILWFGVAFVMISANPNHWNVIFGAVGILILHIFTILYSEQHYLSYKTDYAVYKKNTSMLLLLPQKNKIDPLESDTMKWVTAWGNAQSKTMPLAQSYAKNLTLRYPIFIPFDGTHVRLTLDNFLIDEDAEIEAVTIGYGKELSDLQEEFYYLTFDGERRVTIPAYKAVTSDPLELNCKSDEYLIVSIYIKNCCNLSGGVDITGPLSKGYFAYGNQLESPKLDINTSKGTTWVYFLSNLDIYTENTNEAIICFGDSITSQDWPDYMLLHLRENGIKNISIIRKAVSGTRILREYECITYQSYGKKGKNRFYHEVSSVSGAKKIIIQHGINDIIHPVGEEVNIFRPMSDLPSKEELIAGMEYYASEAKKLNLEVYYGTLLPIYNWRTYQPFREELKNSFNEWIKSRTNLIDFESEVGEEKESVWYFKEGYDSGDHLHPSKKAYDAMGKLAARVLTNDK